MKREKLRIAHEIGVLKLILKETREVRLTILACWKIIDRRISVYYCKVKKIAVET